jgi:hypothetical protein
MYTSSFVDSLPLWLIYIITSAIVLLSIEMGWRFGNYNRKRIDDEVKVPIGAAVGTIFGLLAFLLAFAFGIASSRFDTRRQIVLQEANSIGTTYLRVDFLPEQFREEARNLLREYTAVRAGGDDSFMSSEGVAKSAMIQDRLWTIAASAATESDSITTGLFIQSLNETIDLDAIRVTANRNRIADRIWFMFFVITVFSMAALGYEFGITGLRSWTVTILLVIVFTAVIVLIADLDRPQAGLIRVSQQPLLDLLNKIGPPAP